MIFLNLFKKIGITLVEMIVAAVLVSIIGLAGFILLNTGRNTWLTTDTKIELQNDLRTVVQRLSAELQESGTDKNDFLQIVILDNAGLNNTDILRFKIPLCACGVNAMDENGDVRYWGAPLRWGQSGCGKPFIVNPNDTVTLCHALDDPDNLQTLDVAPSSVKAHLVHGDWQGSCNECDPDNFTNKTIEYLVDQNNHLFRRVLDANDLVLREDVMARNVTDFQVSLDGAQEIVDVSLTLVKMTPQNRPMTMNGGMQVILRNR